MGKKKNTKQFEISVDAVGDFVKQCFTNANNFFIEVSKHKIVVTFEKE